MQVKVLYVRNLKADVSEEQLKEKFEPYGKIERVKKIKDYGFVHFEDRDNAVKAMDELNGTVSTCRIEVVNIGFVNNCSQEIAHSHTSIHVVAQDFSNSL